MLICSLSCCMSHSNHLVIIVCVFCVNNVCVDFVCVGGFLSATTQPMSVTEMGEQNQLGRNHTINETKTSIDPPERER